MICPFIFVLMSRDNNQNDLGNVSEEIKNDQISPRLPCICGSLLKNHNILEGKAYQVFHNSVAIISIGP